MNTIPKLLLALLAAVPLAQSAQPTPDPYMGDWQGTLRLEEGADQPIAVNLIPHGAGQYEARLLSTFERRVPVLFQLRVRFQGGEFRAVDAIPFEVGRVVRATEDGVVVNASLWTGRLDEGVLAGRLVGNRAGQFRLRPMERPSPTLGQSPPAGALVLFDGQNLEAWTPRDPNAGAVRWKLVEERAMEVQGGDIRTKELFGDHRLHLEFRTPYMPQARGQGRGNSGVYLEGRYELQVLDSYGLEGEDNECGGIYTVAKPRVNMCAPPLQWQTYDITFTSARLDADVKKTAPARVTILHNGVVIHEDLELPRVTGGAFDSREGTPGPLLLQDHGNPVRFRNIWIEKR
ncbi:MAG: DUF1080 domain-containing protein [Verrucomicrobia bacterium]|nr:DUF1080 domain-containing protein [Verrucomicrobiota bacterium]